MQRHKGYDGNVCGGYENHVWDHKSNCHDKANMASDLAYENKIFHGIF
jgi:hypothetical protein